MLRRIIFQPCMEIQSNTFDRRYGRYAVGAGRLDPPAQGLSATILIYLLNYLCIKILLTISAKIVYTYM